jgi:predicted tellurium resistance membrane protein TerC
MNTLLNPEVWFSLITLTLVEITLSADNIVFIITASDRLRHNQQKLARKVGLIVAMSTRIAFLSLIFAATHLTTPLFNLGPFPISFRDLIFLFGGGFLIINPLLEMRELRKESEENHKAKHAKFLLVIIQIAIMDIVFSIDSVITAVGLSNQYWVMITAIIIATVFMLVASDYLARLVREYPIVKIMALCLLVLIGFILVLRGFEYHVSSAFIYAPFVFAVFTQAMLKYTKSR